MSRQETDAHVFDRPQERPVRQDSMLYGIQVLRAVAALLVVFRHSIRDATHSPDAFAVGQVGVDIFFVISGVVIALTSRHLSWHVFLRRRAARIVPLYWLLLAIPIAGALVRTLYGQPLEITGNSLFAFVFVPYGGFYPPVLVGWTLNFEMWFYLICGAVLFLGGRAAFHRTVSLIIGAVVIAGLALFAMQGWSVTPATMLLMPLSLEFAAGLWLAHAWQAGLRSSPGLSVLLILGAILWLAVVPASTPTTLFRPLLWGPPALAIVWAFMSLERHIPFARWRFLQLLGTASYALYLIHPRVLELCDRLLPRYVPNLPDVGLIALMIIASLIAGLLLHLLVERPLLVVSKRLLGLDHKAMGPTNVALAEARNASRHL